MTHEEDQRPCKGCEESNVKYEKYYDMHIENDATIFVLKVELKAAREALGKYANPQNWRYWENGDVGAFDAWLDFKPGHYSKTRNDLGLYIAKEALARLDKFLKEVENG